MKKILACCFIFMLGLASLNAQNWPSHIESTITKAFEKGEKTDFLVVFNKKADLSAAQYLRGQAAKTQFVVRQLQAQAAQSQAQALKILRQYDASANSLFLVNAIAVRQGDATLALALAALPEVQSIAADPWAQFDSPQPEPNPLHAQERGTVEWGIEKIKATQVWNLGYRGQGITVGGADTGYDWSHPAINPKYRGWQGSTGQVEHNYNWHDAIHEPSPLNSDSLNPCGFNTQQPCDDGLHGTHTMGTMIGDDGQGNQIGVAPDAAWVGCRNMERGWGRPSTYIECFEWFLAPTDLNGQNPNPNRAPQVINNSWYCADIEGCNSLAVNELMRTAIINLKTAGVFVVVSNGNFGPDCSTTNIPPAYFAESFSVGATQINDTIAPFSSRGPITIDSSYRIKPDVSAPGTGVRSCIPDSNYTWLSGTSMAGPHVAGVVALILSARPEFIGEVAIVETILRQTAISIDNGSQCGFSGGQTPNIAYGYGNIDALAAVELAQLINVPDLEDAAPTAWANPNPTAGDTWLELRNATGSTELQVFDAAGRLVWEQNWSASPMEQVRIPLAQQQEGVYFWKIKSNHQSASGKIVKQ
jgi:serine protease AprX